jgi:hypothetical protein
MPIPPRVAVPVTAAVLCVVVAGGFLFWQLDSTRALLLAGLKPITTSSGDTAMLKPTPDAPVATDDESLLRLRQGDMYSMRGDWKSAEDAYQQSVDAGGGLTALRKLAQAQLQRRDIRGAQTTLDQLQRSGAKKEDVLLLESIIDLRSGELEKARTLLTAADDSPQKHYGLALIAIITSDNDTAKKELTLVENGWEPTLRSFAKTLRLRRICPLPGKSTDSFTDIAGSCTRRCAGM